MRYSVLLSLLLVAAPVSAQVDGDPPLPAEELKGQLKVFLETGGHAQPIVFAGFTKDDTRLVTVGRDGTVQVWDVATGKRLRKLLLPVMTEIWNAALAPDDRTVAVSVSGVAFTPEGEKEGTGILLVNIEDGRVFPLTGATPYGKQVFRVFGAVTFSPTGDRLAGRDNKNVLHVWPNVDQVWDKVGKLSVKEQAELLKPKAYPKAKGQLDRLQFSSDGKQILAVYGIPGGGVIFDATPGGETKPGMPLQYPEGSEKNTKLPPNQKNPNIPDKDFILSVAFAPDGKTLLTGGYNRGGYLTRWSRDGKFLKYYSLPKQKPDVNKDWLDKARGIMQLYPLHDNSILIASDGYQFNKGTYAGFVGAAVWDLNTGVVRNCLKETELAEISSRTFVSNNKKLAVTTVNAGRDLLLWNIADGKVFRRIASKAQTPVRVGWHKDNGRHVLAWGYGSDPAHKDFGKLTHAFDFDTLQRADSVQPIYTGRLHQLGLWSAGYKTTTSSRIWVEVKKADKNLPKAPPTLTTVLEQRGHYGIGTFTFVPRGQQSPVVAFSYFNWVRLADANNGNILQTSPARFAEILDLAASPDGKYLAVATGSQQLAILSAATGETLLSLYFAGQDWIAWTETGHYAASPGGEKMMGWVASDGLSTQATFHPASRFRKQFYRPDVIARILKEGNFDKALAAANAAVKAQGGKVQDEVKLEKTLPPGGAIDTVDTSKLPKITVHVKAAAAHPDDPLTKLELLADGRPLFGKDGIKELAKPVQNVTAAFDVELPPGSYKLMVRIWSKKTWSVSTEAQVTYTSTAVLKQPKAKLHVLAVGASQYKNHPGLDLPSPANDAKQIAQLLPKQCGPPLFAPGVSQTFIGAQATSGNVYQAIQDLSKQVKPEDVAVIYFGGHGLKAPTGGLYLLTYDADVNHLDKTALSGAKLREALAKVECRGVILILDACHSGALGPKSKPVTDDLTRELTDDDCGVVVWCSALGVEKAQVDDKAGHGLFTLSLLKALSDKDGAPASKYDGKVYLHHIQTYLFDEVQYHSGQRQHPSLNIPWTVESFPLRAPAKGSS